MIQIQIGNIRSPVRHRTLAEMIQALQPVIQHPFRFALHCRDLADNLFVQSLFGLENRNIGILKCIGLVIQSDVIVIVFRFFSHSYPITTNP